MRRVFIRSFLLLMCILFSACQPVELGYSPPIIVPVRVSINTAGEIELGLSPELHTPIGTFDISFGADVYSLREEYDARLLIVILDDKATVYKLAEGKEFKIAFDDSNKLYRSVNLKQEDDGDIILQLQSVSVAEDFQGSEEAQVTVEPMPTSTPEPPPCYGVMVTPNDTSKGNILHIEGCPNWIFDSPPFAKGSYAISPNEKFLIYCTTVGDLYAIRFRDQQTINLGNLRKDMPVFHTGDVSIGISISSGENQYFARIVDRISGQSLDFGIPLSISQ